MNTVLILLAILSPLVGSGGIALTGRSLNERCAIVGIVALSVSALSSLVVLTNVAGGEVMVLEIPIGAWPMPVMADRLSGIMMTLISLVSLVIHVYSARYMVGDAGYVRFYVLLGLVTFVLLSLVTSGHLLWVLVCWHLVTWLLAALLAFNTSSRAAKEAARRTLWIQGLGDVAFGVAVAVLYAGYGSFDLRELFERVGHSQPGAPLTISFGLEWDVVSLSTLCLVLSIMTKSAQFPFHVWLPGTIEAPTPVSALLHAGIVNAGGFLVNRMAPVFGQAPTTLYLLFLVGSVTALIGATSMLTEPSIKRKLVYSTMGQMGYMVMECGLGAFALAVFHLCAHGLFKATLFLNSGVNIHLSRTEFQLPDSHVPEKPTSFSVLAWATGLGMTLLLPLGMLLIGHGLVEVPLFEVQGATIFLFFAWVTSSQAIFSLYRLQSEASWSVSLTMVATLALIGFTYLWAGEAFTHFLYGETGEAARYFDSAAWPQGLFETFIVLAALLVVGTWMGLYAKAHGRRLWLPDRVHGLWAWCYVAFLNNLYVEEALRARRSRARREPARYPEMSR